MAPSDSLGLKIGRKVQTACNNLLRGPSYGPFCSKFRCHDNRGRAGVNINDVILANPENHTLKPIITTLSYT